MKFFLSAVAISALTAGAALAQDLTSSDRERLQRIVPNADLTMVTGEAAALLSAYIDSGDIDRDPAAADYIRSVLAGDMSASPMATVTLTESDIERITRLAPAADLTMISQEQSRLLQQFVNSAQYDRAPANAAYVEAVLAGEVTATPDADGSLSSSDAELVRMIVPDADLSDLTEDQAAEISAFVNSTDYGRGQGDAEFLRELLRS